MYNGDGFADSSNLHNGTRGPRSQPLVLERAQLSQSMPLGAQVFCAEVEACFPRGTRVPGSPTRLARWSAQTRARPRPVDLLPQIAGNGLFTHMSSIKRRQTSCQTTICFLHDWLTHRQPSSFGGPLGRLIIISKPYSINSQSPKPTLGPSCGINGWDVPRARARPEARADRVVDDARFFCHEHIGISLLDLSS